MPGLDPTKAPKGWECSNCGNFNDPDEDYCDNCGADTDGALPEDKDRTDLIVLGRVIGTFTGWDQGDTNNFVFYGFKPKSEGMPEGDLNVDYENGYFKFHDDAGNETWSNDIIERLKDIPRE